ncbi:hypothetical protein [Angustibacter aerolatus]
MQKIVMSLTVVVAAAAALSGCGGDDSTTAAPAASSSSSTSSPATSSAPASPTTSPSSPAAGAQDPNDPDVQAKALDTTWDALNADGRKQLCQQVGKLGKQKAADQVVAAQAKVTSVKFKTQVVVDFFDRHC